MSEVSEIIDICLASSDGIFVAGAQQAKRARSSLTPKNWRRLAESALQSCLTSIAREEWTRAHAGLILGLLIDSSRLLRAERLGIFVDVSDKYISRKPFLDLLAVHSATTLNSLHPRLAERLASYRALEVLTELFRLRRQEYLGFLRDRPLYLIKGMLALADLTFLLPSLRGIDPSKIMQEIFPQELSMGSAIASPEQTAEIVSLCLAEAAKTRPITRAELNVEAIQAFRNSDFWTALESAAISHNLHRYRKALTLLGYDLRQEKIGKFRLFHSNPNLEKQIQYTKIARELRVPLLEESVRARAPTPMREIAQTLLDRFVELTGSPLYFEASIPYSRYVINAPPAPLVKPFLEGGYYFDDMMEMADELDLLIEPDSLDKTRVGSTLDMGKFRQLYRALRFYCELHSVAMIDAIRKSPFMVVNSLLPVLQEDDISALLPEEEKEDTLREFRKILEWDAASNEFLDLQYSPIINVKGNVVIAPRILLYSQSLRSVMFRRKFRVEEAADYLVSRTRKLLVSRFGPERVTGKEFEIKSKALGESGDIDLALLANGVLYIFECKHSLPPASFHETADVYADVAKGAEQLQKCQRILGDTNYLRQLVHSWFPSLPGPEKSVKQIRPCIVLSSRDFSGTSIEGIPIRDPFSMRPVLNRGCVEFGTSSGGRISPNWMKFWKGENFSPEDFDDYMSDDGVYWRFCRLYMDECARLEIGLPGVSVAFETFVANIPNDPDMVERNACELGLHSRESSKNTEEQGLPLDDTLE